MGSTISFSKAAWELRMAFLKPPEECTHISRNLLKSYLELAYSLGNVVNTTARGLREISENS
jgi:hypothetical protein